ncbi:MAG: hypothetical protein Q9179_001353 [Wetmoreana sp. 5 TL-2023]
MRVVRTNLNLLQVRVIETWHYNGWEAQYHIELNRVVKLSFWLDNNAESQGGQRGRRAFGPKRFPAISDHGQTDWKEAGQVDCPGDAMGRFWKSSAGDAQERWLGNPLASSANEEPGPTAEAPTAPMTILFRNESSQHCSTLMAVTARPFCSYISKDVVQAIVTQNHDWHIRVPRTSDCCAIDFTVLFTSCAGGAGHRLVCQARWSTFSRLHPPRSNGQTHQEPLGSPHRPHCRYLYGYAPPPSNNFFHYKKETDNPTDQVAAALEGFFWPKIFWDFLTTNLDGAVRPIPILQILNFLLGILALAWEWPISLFSFTKTAMHRSIEARLAVYPLSSLAALLLYQGTNPGIYYLVGMGVYFWAYSEGEVRHIPHSDTGPILSEHCLLNWAIVSAYLDDCCSRPGLPINSYVIIVLTAKLFVPRSYVQNPGPSLEEGAEAVAESSHPSLRR